MYETIEQDKNAVQEIYDYLLPSVREVVRDITAEIDDIVSELSKGINLFTNSQLWDFQMRLSVEAYRIGNIKEQAFLKEACAEALYKEGLARSYNATVGTQEAKKQQAVIDSVGKQAIAMVYATASSLLKTKYNDAYKLISTIQNIQISRAAEAKLKGSPRSEVDVDFNVQQGEY